MERHRAALSTALRLYAAPGSEGVPPDSVTAPRLHLPDLPLAATGCSKCGVQPDRGLESAEIENWQESLPLSGSADHYH